MIKLFSPADKQFNSNGDKIITPIKALVHKQDNGDFYLELEVETSFVDYLKPRCILVAPTPQGEQGFRISKIQKNRGKISVRANHLFYDSENYVIKNKAIVEKDCDAALKELNTATDYESPFQVSSNVSTISSWFYSRSSLCSAIQTIVEKWGGHLVRDNFKIEIREAIGKDNGILVQRGKNTMDITCEENWDNVVTKLLPVGKDGLLLEDRYVYSSTQYEIPYTKTVSFEQDLNEEDFENETDYKNALINDLTIQAQNYVYNNSIPKVNYKIKANLEKVSDIGDTIYVIDERLGLNLETTIISFDYDCILKKYTEIEFGNFTQKLSGLMSTISNNTQNAIQEASQNMQITISDELKEAQDKIWNALGSSYCIYEGDKILIVDTVPKENATNVIMINNGGIAFSNSGIEGPFKSAWTIDNVLNMEQINVINLTANLIKGGTLKLGSNLNQNGQLEVYDTANNLIAELNNNGLKMYGKDGSYILMNNDIGFAGYDRLGNQIYWVSQDEFHQKKSVIEEEITLCNKIRFIPITIEENGEIINDGIGIVSVYGGGS